MPTRMPRIAQLAGTVVLAAGAFALAEQPTPVRIVQVQATCVRVPAGFCERAGLTACQPTATSGAAVLTAREAKMLAAMVEAVQDKDEISRPTLCMLDGQQGSVATGQNVLVATALQPASKGDANAYTLKTALVSTGLMLEVTPKLSADGKYITLCTAACYSDLPSGGVQIPVEGGQKTVTIYPNPGGPVANSRKIKTELSVPDGGTAVLVGPAGANEGKAPGELLWILTANVDKPPPAK